MTTKHLDLGCGAVARNPYNRDEVHSVDLAAPSGMALHLFRQANLSLAPIPHPDSTFDHPASFHDPTHVNISTHGTSGYFCGDLPLARMYGYVGAFTALRNDWAMLPEDFVRGSSLGLRRKLRKWRLKRAGRLSHVVWEFVCIKGAP